MSPVPAITHRLTPASRIARKGHAISDDATKNTMSVIGMNAKSINFSFVSIFKGGSDAV